MDGRLEVDARNIRFFPERIADSISEDTTGADTVNPEVAWVPDSASNLCAGCRKPIVRGVFLSGKHHCRRYACCGAL